MTHGINHWSLTDAEREARNALIGEAYRAGARTGELVERFSMSRQGIRQALRSMGLGEKDGGAALHRRQVNVGDRFDRLLVLGYLPGTARASGAWECECDCGKHVLVKASALTSGHSRSCGCWRRDMQDAMRRSRRGPGWAAPGRQTHTYYIWCSMKGRCFNPSDQAYRYYGARGITVCDRWRDSFAAFLEDMGGECPAGLEIDRIDVEGNYEPGNCRWATDEEQSNNMRCNRITPSGMTVAQAARHEGIPYHVAYRKYVTVGKAPWRSNTCAKAREHHAKEHGQ